MKIFITALVLIINFQLCAKADAISDFEIEGISIGDSLLDYYSKEEIENSRFEFTSSNNKYVYSEMFGPFENYENLQFIYRSEDKNYQIAAIVGLLFYDNNLNGCLKKKEIITNSVESIISSDTDIYSEDGYPHSPSFPKTLIYTTEFTFKSGDVLRVYCMNWSKNVEKKHGWTDHLSLNIQTAEFYYWLNNEAYQ